MYIKIRKTDNVIFGSQKTSFELTDNDFYEVEYEYNFPSVQPYYNYKWDEINNKVIFNDDAKSIELENRKTYSNLRIIKFIDDNEIKHKDFDFTLVLLKDEPLYHKGLKIKQDYLDPETEELIVSKHYSEIIGDRIIFGKTSPNRILGLEIRIDWYDFYGNVGSTKIQKVKKFNREEEGERKLVRRQRQIAILKALALGTPAEPVVDAIYTYYDEQVRFYINQGTSVFYDALMNETDSTMLYYLNIKLPRTHTENLIISDYIKNDDDNYEFTIDKDYSNCMLQFIDTGTTLNVSGTIPGYTENDNNTVKYLGFFDNKIKFEIVDSNFIRQDGVMTIYWKNTIKDYIIHEISPLYL